MQKAAANSNFCIKENISNHTELIIPVKMKYDRRRGDREVKTKKNCQKQITTIKIIEKEA